MIHHRVDAESPDGPAGRNPKTDACARHFDQKLAANTTTKAPTRTPDPQLPQRGLAKTRLAMEGYLNLLRIW